MAGSFEVVTDGFIAAPYQNKYNFSPVVDQNTYRFLDGAKVGCIVTLSAEGKPDATFYHEIENFSYEGLTQNQTQQGFPDNDAKNHWLQKLADDYSNS